MKFGVIGLGLIGGSMAKGLRSFDNSVEFYGTDLSAENTEKAVELGIIDQSMSLEELLKTCDVVCVATPVSALIKELPEFLDAIGPSQTIFDCGSTKETVCNSVKSHKNRGRFVACHPIAGTENSGPSAAFSYLFQGETMVICEKDRSDKDALKNVLTIFDGMKMRIVHMDPEEHDVHAAYVSHLSHVSSFALANTVLDKEKDVSAIFDLAGSGFSSTVRLAMSSPKMWDPIFSQNKTYLLEAVDAYIDHLNDYREHIKSDEKGSSLPLLERANDIRRVLKKRRVKSNEPQKAINELRAGIAHLDRQILRLISDRLSIARGIGGYKKEVGMDPNQPDQWKQVLDRNVSFGKSLNLYAEFIEKLYNLIHEESVEAQKGDSHQSE